MMGNSKSKRERPGKSFKVLGEGGGGGGRKPLRKMDYATHTFGGCWHGSKQYWIPKKLSQVRAIRMLKDSSKRKEVANILDVPPLFDRIAKEVSVWWFECMGTVKDIPYGCYRVCWQVARCDWMSGLKNLKAFVHVDGKKHFETKLDLHLHVEGLSEISVGRIQIPSTEKGSTVRLSLIDHSSSHKRGVCFISAGLRRESLISPQWVAMAMCFAKDEDNFVGSMSNVMMRLFFFLAEAKPVGITHHHILAYR